MKTSFPRRRALLLLPLLTGPAIAAEVSFSSYTTSGPADTSWVVTDAGVASINFGGSDVASFGSVAWEGSQTNGHNPGETYATVGAYAVYHSNPSIAWANNAAATFHQNSGAASVLSDGTWTSGYAQLDINGLVPGKTYSARFIVADDRAVGARTISIDALGGNTGSSGAVRYAYTDGRYAVITATWTADSTSATFANPVNGGSSGTQINGFQIVEVPVLSSSLTWNNGAGDFVWSSTALNWSGSAWDNSNLTSAVFGSTGAGTLTLGEAITAKDLTFNAAGYTIAGGTLTLIQPVVTTQQSATISSSIDGIGGLTKEGTATLTLAGANPFSGLTTVNAGTLALTDNLALQSSAFNSASTGTLDLGAVNTPTLGGLDGSAALTLPANVTLLTLNPPSGSISYSGSLGGGAAGLALVKSGAGTQVLSGTNGHAGGTTIGGGTLVAASSSALGGGALTFDGGTLSAANSPTFSNPVVVASSGVVNTPLGSNLFLNGNLSGAGNLTKTGPFSLVLGGDNSGFTGTLSHGASNLFFTSASSGSAAAAWETTGGSLVANISNTDPTIFLGSLAGTGLLANGGSNSAVTYSIGALGSNSTFSGNIQDQVGGSSSSVALIKTGGGTLTLAGNSSYSGDTTVNGGTLEFAAGSQLRFVVTDTPAANQVAGSAAALFNGSFNIDTSGVAGTSGGIWLLVDRAALAGESFGPAFAVNGFADPEDDGVWTRTDAKGDWVFSEASGELTLDIPDDYLAWGALYGLAAGSEAGDADNDGLTNEEEYAFGLIPNSGASVNPIVVPLDKSTGSFSYTRRDPSLTTLTYSVWFSENLSSWIEDTGAVEGEPVLDGDVETVPVTLSPLAGNPLPAKLFIQLRAN